MTSSQAIYFRDCASFRGDIPCKPHKELGVHCNDCKYYEPRKEIILIIKLGAIGDVIRTSPLIHRIRRDYPESLIWWLTYSPEVVPSLVNKVFDFSNESILTLQATDFRRVINLDKDLQACALTKMLKADEKFGFTLLDGKPAPVNNLAEHKFLTGIYDDVNKANTKSYLEEIFEINGWKFEDEEYILDIDDSFAWKIPSAGKRIIGLNTGCGARWTSRLWKDEYWEDLIYKLIDGGFFPVLLGGPQEHDKHQRLSKITGAYYPGYFPLKQFISLVGQCDTVVTAVTMAMHIAIGLRKKVVSSTVENLNCMEEG
jgi:heptosyltransferase-2